MPAETMNAIQALAAISQALVSCIGLPGLVISLLLLWRQSREQTIATRAMIHQNLTTTMIDIDKFFIEHPELKPYFYNNADIAEHDPDYARVQSTAEMFLDFADFVLMHKPEMKNYPWDEWEDYFLEIYAHSPMTRRFWGGKRDWYKSTLTPLFDSPRAQALLAEIK